MRKQLNRAFLCVGLLTLVASIHPVTAAQYNWGAYNLNGMGEQDGTVLAQSNLVRLGTFTNISLAQIQSATPSTLDSYFVEFANSTIGTGSGADGYFQLSSTFAIPSSLVGSNIFIWAFNATSLGAATEQGLFSSTNSSWILPSDGLTVNVTIDMTDLTTDGLGQSLAGGAIIPWGGFGTGTLDGNPLFNLEAIPEPSTYALIVVGLAFVCGLRFRRRK